MPAPRFNRGVTPGIHSAGGGADRTPQVWTLGSSSGSRLGTALRTVTRGPRVTDRAGKRTVAPLGSPLGQELANGGEQLARTERLRHVGVGARGHGLGVV